MDWEVGTDMYTLVCIYWEFPGGWMVKNSHVSEGVTEDGGSIPGSGRSPGGVNGNPLQHSCWYNQAPVLWPRDVKSQLTGKDPDAGKD